MKRLKYLLEEKTSSLRTLRRELFSFKWFTVFFVLNLYVGGSIGLYYLAIGCAKFDTCLWLIYTFLIGGIGLGPGSHRLFSHRSYKATRAFRIFLLFCHSLAGQYSMIFWCKVHRAHHKFTDTDRDPTNINRGFMFAHFFWNMRFTPECQKAMDAIDIADLISDGDVMFQYRNIVVLNVLCCVMLPTIVPYLLWDESLWVAFFVNEFRWLLNYNQMSFANSFMHVFGTKPYDRTMTAAEHLFSILFTFGEGYHNFHHVFPWDYRSAEVGDLLHFNVSTVFLDVCAWLGLVYDRKVVTQQMIERRKARTGDGSDYLASKHEKRLWGFGDVDMDVDDRMDLHDYLGAAGDETD